MKLLSCHIENFGRLENLDLQFQDGLNPILRENGWGKSTFAHFLLVMFYGFVNERKKSDLENERRRFAPWQNGVYGGSVTFIWHDRKYRLERTFGPRDGKEDQMAQFDADTNLACHDFSSVPGEDIFSLDRASFERTIFIGQQSVHTDVTADIHAKIGDLTGEQADMRAYDPVQKRLKAETDRLTPSRKTGSIHQMKDHLAELSAVIAEKSGEEYAYHQNNLRTASLQQTKRDLLNELEQLQGQQRALSREKDIGVQRELYENCRREEEKALRDRNALREKFPDEVPDIAEVEEWLAIANAMDGKEQSSESLDFSPEQQREYLRLCSVFRSGVPEDAQIAQAEDLLRSLQILRHKVSRDTLSTEEEEKRQALATYFSRYLPQQEEIAGKIQSWGRRNTIVSALPQKKANARLLKKIPAQEDEIRQQAGNKGHLIAGVFLLLAGIGLTAAVLWFMPQLRSLTGAAFAALPAAGVLCLFLGIFFILSGRHGKNEKYSTGRPQISQDSADAYRKLSIEISEDEAEIDRIEEDVQSLFEKIGISVPLEDTYQTLYEILGDVKAYQELESRAQASGLGEDRRRSGEMQARLDQFLDRFYPGRDVSSDEGQVLQELKFDARRYREFLALKDRQQKAEAHHSEQEEGLRDYLGRIGYLPEQDKVRQLTRIRDQLKQLASLNEIWQMRKSEREQFEERHNMGQILAGQDGKYVPHKASGQMQSSRSLESNAKKQEEIHQKISELESEILSSQREAERINERLDTIAEAEAEWEQSSLRLQQMEHRYDLLMTTRRFLEEARTRFSAKFMEPVRAEYMKYYQLLSKDDGKEYTLDADLNIRVREAGASRDVGYLSEGYQDLVGLCRRMAMIEIMYKNEKPFLLFDDPFVNLDDRKLEGAGDFLQKIAERYQIIYLTCQKARDYEMPSADGRDGA
ncbi:MAG: AAA family ATPase [Eubacterium sp.]|nr:AAA family ATPase [Eubacterium sp.]